MSTNLRTLAALGLAALLAAGAAACTSAGHKPAAGAAGDDSAVTTNAKNYLAAWYANPPRPQTMCELETVTARPNADAGGSIDGCVKEYGEYFKDRTAEPGRPALAIDLGPVQSVPASAHHPAGKAVLATMHRDGEETFLQALRLVKDGSAWHVAQHTDVSARDAAAPLATLLERTE
ncbi:hypothetical protein [Kitasatospora sp. NPDC088783]|uniref:hypothetical protein n=1 Tax=Kitasatospora sp. NPDC088783 TaxID=3364077 RepID=UPI00380F81AB